MPYYRSTVLVSVDPIAVEKGAYEVKEKIIAELEKLNLLAEVQVIDTPRIGDPVKDGPEVRLGRHIDDPPARGTDLPVGAPRRRRPKRSIRAF